MANEYYPLDFSDFQLLKSWCKYNNSVIDEYL